MSGDSTFGNSNVAASPLSDSDDIEISEEINDSNPADSRSVDQSIDAELKRQNEAILAKHFAEIGDSINESLPEPPAANRLSRWRKTSTQNKREAAKLAEEQLNVTSASIDSVEERVRTRRRPFSTAPKQDEQKKRQEAALALDVTCESAEESAEKVVYKRPLPFSRHAAKKKNKKMSEEDIHAFDLTSSSIEDKQPRVTRGFSKRHDKKRPATADENPFDATDTSVVVDRSVEQKRRRFSRASKKQLTEEDVNAFDVSDCEDEDDEDGAENHSQDVEKNDDLVLALNEDGVSNSVIGANEKLPDDDARNSMDESEESGNEDESIEGPSLEIQPRDLEDDEGEDSLDEDVVPDVPQNMDTDENEAEKRKNDAVEGGSINEQSSLLLEYQLSSDNRSESRLVAESNNRSASFRRSNCFTVDITLASRRSRRFSQFAGSPVSDAGSVASTKSNKRKSRDDRPQNLEKSFDDLGEVINVSPLAPVVVNSPRISPHNQILGSGDVNPSKRNCDEILVDAETSNRSGKRRSAAKDLFSSGETPSTGKDSTGNKSMQNDPDANDSIGLLDGSIRPLDEAGDINRSLKVTTRDVSNKSIKETNNSEQKDKSMNYSINVSEISNRSLRNESETNKDDNSNHEDKSMNVLDTSSRSLRSKTTKDNNSNEKDKSMNDLETVNRSGSKTTEDNNSKQEDQSMNDSMNVLDTSSRSLRSKTTKDNHSNQKDKSMNDSMNGLETVNRSGSKTTEDNNSKQKDKSMNDSKNDLDTSSRSLRSKTTKDNNSNQKVKSMNDLETSNRSGSKINELDNSKQKDKSLTDSLNRSLQSGSSISKDGSKKRSRSMNESLSSNRSLRNRTRGKEDSNKSLNEEQTSNRVADENVGLAENDEIFRRNGSSGRIRSSINRSTVGAVTSSSEENRRLRLRGSKETSSVLYDSLNSFAEAPSSSSKSMLLLPQPSGQPMNNSMDSTVNLDQNYSSLHRSSDEMPAPRDFPAQKRRLANVDCNTPSFSALTQKRKDRLAGESELMNELVEKENQLAAVHNQALVAGKVDYKCPKLKKPANWVTTRLYNWIIERLEPRYKLQARLRAERFVVDTLCPTVKSVTKKTANYDKEIDDFKFEMARLNLVENTWDFFTFIDQFLPWQFQDKSLPLPEAFIQGPVVSYKKGTLFDPIL